MLKEKLKILQGFSATLYTTDTEIEMLKYLSRFFLHFKLATILKNFSQLDKKTNLVFIRDMRHPDKKNRFLEKNYNAMGRSVALQPNLIEKRPVFY